MNGKEAYDNKFEMLSLNRIQTTDPDWKLYGFFNSIIIKRSYKTAYTYLGYVINFLNGYVDNIKDIDIDAYYAFMASLKQRSSSEQIGAYHALQKYSKYLKAKNIAEDYMAYIERPKFIESQKTIEKREKGYLTKQEAKKMIGEVDNLYKNDIWRSRNYAIMMIFLTTGIRCSALYKLDVDNIDLDNRTIYFYEKGSKNRIVNIPEKTIEAIADWIKYRDMILGSNSNEEALIISTHKKRMESTSIYLLIKKIGSIIVGKNITPHKLRATYGTNLYEKTGDVFFVQQCMGHSNPKTTELYIRGQKNASSKKAAELMSGFLD